MNFTLTTKQSGPNGIFSELRSQDNSIVFDTLEHAYLIGQEWLPKVARGVTYICTRYYSPDHGYNVFVLRSVPIFDGQPVTYIEIHIGNYNKDSKGCILVGLARGPTMIEESETAFKAFMEIQKDVDTFSLTVI
jgi:hypothetical protein